jgi:FixJ family two-component response regulator
MPGLSGVELVKRIQLDNPGLPIVVVTGWAGAQDLDEVRRLGVTDIVEKPWALKYVDEALRTLGSVDEVPARTDDAARIEGGAEFGWSLDFPTSGKRLP